MKSAKEILSNLRDRAKADSARQSTTADLQKHEIIRQQIRARASALSEVAGWLDSEIQKL